jgi:hypothetical protein
LAGVVIGVFKNLLFTAMCRESRTWQAEKNRHRMNS